MSKACVLSLVLCAFLGAGSASADFLLHSENFDSMGPSGTAPPAGWTVGYLNPVKNRDVAGGEGAAPVSQTLIVTNGTANGTTNGESYNYGTTGAADRAIGNLPRTPFGDHIMQVQITNNTGVPLTGLTLNYWGEQWRRSQSASSSGPEMLRVFFNPTTSNSGFVSMGSALEFTAPQNGGAADTPLDGNAAANRAFKTASYTPGAPIAPGSTFTIRWYDWNDNGTLDHGLGIDDVEVLGVPEPATVGLLVLGGLTLVRRRR